MFKEIVETMVITYLHSQKKLSVGCFRQSVLVFEIVHFILVLLKFANIVNRILQDGTFVLSGISARITTKISNSDSAGYTNYENISMRYQHVKPDIIDSLNLVVNH